MALVFICRSTCSSPLRLPTHKDLTAFRSPFDMPTGSMGTSQHSQAPAIDEETVKYICRGLTSGDRQLQRRIVDEYVADDVKFTHVLGYAQGKEALYRIYRSATFAFNYDLIFHDIVINDRVAVVHCNLNLKIPPFYLLRRNVPVVVLLRLRRCADGRVRVCEQMDHHSVFGFVWAVGAPWTTFFNRVVLPMAGSLAALNGWALDLAADAVSAAKAWGHSWLQQVLEAVEPAGGVNRTWGQQGRRHTQ